MFRSVFRFFASILIMVMVSILAAPHIERAEKRMTAFFNWHFTNYANELETLILSDDYKPGNINEYVERSSLSYILSTTMLSFFTLFTGIIVFLITNIVFMKLDKRSLKKKQKLLIQTQKLYIEALSNVNTVFFDYDVRSGMIVFSEMFAKRHGLPTVISSDEKNLRKIHIDYQGDLPSFSVLLLDFKNSHEPKERTFQSTTADGQCIWYNITVTSSFKVKWRKQKKQRALAVVRDITEEKNAELLLKTKAEQDAMTGLYNKSGGIHPINHILQESTPHNLHALYVLDLDNFKQVNDVLGHVVGDTAIIDAAQSLQQIFRQSDILCRFGGDEFVVFTAHINDPAAALRKANEICRALQRSYKDDTHEVQISASVGIALYPSHGQSYDELFENADEALYKVKEKSKNAYALYGEEILS